MRAGFWDPNAGVMRWFFYERLFFKFVDRVRTHRSLDFADSVFCGSGRLRQRWFLFQSCQHPQVVRQHLPAHRQFPMGKSFGAQRSP